MKILLTDTAIISFAAAKKWRYEVSDIEMTGLRLRVGTSGSKTFILRKRIDGKVRNISLGKFNPDIMNISDARRKAKVRIEIELSPIDHNELIFCNLFSKFEKQKVKQRSFPEIKRIFEKYLLPEFGQRQMATIRRSEISRFVDKLAFEGPLPRPAMARAVAAQLSSFFSWAMSRIDEIETNPCRYIARSAQPTPRERVLSLEEIAALWKVLNDEVAPWGPAVKIMILTGQRRGEVFQASKAQFNETERTWIIPSSGAKNGRGNIVPLSDACFRLVSECFDSVKTDLLFPSSTNPHSGVSGFSKAMTRIRLRLRERGLPKTDFTLHDIRRTVATGLQSLGVKIEVTEAILNHRSGTVSGIVRTYQRHEFLVEKRAALEAWADLLSSVLDVDKG